MQVDIGPTPRKMLAYHAEGRAVLVLLGFHGIQDFAKRARIDHVTASVLFYSHKYRTHFNSLLKAYTAMHEAYQDVQPKLNKAQRSYIKDFAKRWLKINMGRVSFETPGRLRSKTGAWDKQRDTRRERVKAACWKAVNSIHWS